MAKPEPVNPEDALVGEFALFGGALGICIAMVEPVLGRAPISGAMELGLGFLGATIGAGLGFQYRSALRKSGQPVSILLVSGCLMGALMLAFVPTALLFSNHKPHKGQPAAAQGTTITRNNYGWTSEAAAAQLHTAMRANDTAAILRMQQDGRLIPLFPGQPVAVVSAGLVSHRVWIVGGAYDGHECEIIAEALRP